MDAQSAAQVLHRDAGCYALSWAQIIGFLVGTPSRAAGREAVLGTAPRCPVPAGSLHACEIPATSPAEGFAWAQPRAQLSRGSPSTGPGWGTRLSRGHHGAAPCSTVSTYTASCPMLACHHRSLLPPL